MEIQNKKVIVIGSGASGIGAAKLAKSKKAQVCIYDKKNWNQQDDKVKQSLKELESLGIELRLGEDIDTHVLNYELIVMSPGVPMDVPFVVGAKNNNIPIIGEFEFASMYCKAPITAITGTNGKTTTTALVGEIVKSYIADTYVVGNIGRAFSEDVEMIQSNDAVVAEVSSFQLESIDTFHPKISGILNITPDHLNRHGTMENYIGAKKRIFENQTKDDFIILNYDDPECVIMESETKANVIWFSKKQKVTPGVYLKNEYITEEINGVSSCICHINDLKILGEHNVENALAAVAITRAMDIPVPIIREKIISFEGVANRLEYVGTKRGVDFYNDSKATNPDAAIKGLLAMRKGVRLIVGGLDKKVDFTKWVELFLNRVKGVYVIGETKKQLIDTMKQQKFSDYKTFDTLEEAVREAYNDAKKEECVLLSPGCASWDMFRDYEERGNLFKEVFHDLRE